MNTMWKLVFLILCANYFTLGLHIRRRETYGDYNVPAELGAQCEEDDDCIHEHSYCNKNEGLCACVKDFEEKNEKCVEKPKVGTECENDDTCSSLANSACVEKVCKCKDDFLPSEGKDSCLKLAEKAGDECQIEDQCSKLSESTCKENKCVVLKDIGEKCMESSECSKAKNLECKNDICECLENYVESEKTCLKKAEKIDDACSDNGQCVHLLASCKDNKCVADPTPLPPLPPQINENSCSETENCTDENTKCVEGSCQCEEGFIRSENSKNCLKEAEKLGEECKEDVQCSNLGNVTCQSEVCAEKPVEQTIKAVATSSKIGDSCVADSECQHIANSQCKENVCQCNLEEYITSEDDNKCLKKAKNEGDECVNDKQCEGIAEAVCSESKCVKAPLRGQILDDSSDRDSATSLRTSGILSAILLIGIIRLI